MNALLYKPSFISINNWPDFIAVFPVLGSISPALGGDGFVKGIDY
jgi:hypothetical protein